MEFHKPYGSRIRRQINNLHADLNPTILRFQIFKLFEEKHHVTYSKHSKLQK